MNLYLISQDVNTDWDSYDLAVVIAESKDDARTIHPGGSHYESHPYKGYYSYSWTDQENVQVKFLGVADKSLSRGVVCASFNGG